MKLAFDILIQGAKDVGAMKLSLVKEWVNVEEDTINIDKMLESLQISSTEANIEGYQVVGIKLKCEEDKTRIGLDISSCANDLAKAQPLVNLANEAINSIP